MVLKHIEAHQENGGKPKEAGRNPTGGYGNTSPSTNSDSARPLKA
jgi:hypothetical protein